MSIIITIDEDLHILDRYISAFCLKHALPNPNLSRSTIGTLVFKLYDDKLSEMLKWMSATTDFDALLEHYLPWFAINGRDDISSSFITEVIDPIEIRTRNIITKYVPTRTYNLITLKQIREVLILNIGEDYRIVEWEHLIRTGVIKHPTRRL